MPNDSHLSKMTEQELDALATLVILAPEMEPVHELGRLRAQHKDELDQSVSLRMQATKAQADVPELERSRSRAQVQNDYLGDLQRKSEEHAFKALLAAKGIEDLREIHGAYTRKVVRAKALEGLKGVPLYVERARIMGENQAKLDSLVVEIPKAKELANRLKDEADAMARKAGETLKAVRSLEEKLDAESK